MGCDGEPPGVGAGDGGCVSDASDEYVPATVPLNGDAYLPSAKWGSSPFLDPEFTGGHSSRTIPTAQEQKRVSPWLGSHVEMGFGCVRIGVCGVCVGLWALLTACCCACGAPSRLARPLGNSVRRRRRRRRRLRRRWRLACLNSLLNLVTCAYGKLYTTRSNMTD